MTTASLFQWVILQRDVPNTLARVGVHAVSLKENRAVIVDLLPANSKQPEPGYTLEIFKDGETIDIVSVPISWAIPASETWGKSRSEVAVTRAEIS
jgi:hypothetical protein